VREFDSPAGYLYRVGWTLAVRSEARDVPVAEPAPAVASPDDSFEPGLAPAIACLSEAQRCAVVLVVGFGYTLREAAEVLGVTASTVHRDSERALARLRSELEVENAH
jgi:RNA polymerase sigma factor (sigma-70 family)